ncbi:unnamed protein product, partial [Urochloa humidicola]
PQVARGKSPSIEAHLSPTAELPSCSSTATMSAGLLHLCPTEQIWGSDMARQQQPCPHPLSSLPIVAAAIAPGGRPLMRKQQDATTASHH